MGGCDLHFTCVSVRFCRQHDGEASAATALRGTAPMFWVRVFMNAVPWSDWICAFQWPEKLHNSSLFVAQGKFTLIFWWPLLLTLRMSVVHNSSYFNAQNNSFWYPASLSPELLDIGHHASAPALSNGFLEPLGLTIVRDHLDCVL